MAINSDLRVEGKASPQNIQHLLEKIRRETESLLALVVLPTGTTGVYRLAYGSGTEAAPVRQAYALLQRLVPGLGEQGFRIYLQRSPTLRGLLSGADARVLTDFAPILEATDLPPTAFDFSVKMTGVRAVALFRFPLRGSGPGFLLLLRREPVVVSQLDAWRSHVRLIAKLVAEAERSSHAAQPALESLLPPEYAYDRLRIHHVDTASGQSTIVSQVPDEAPGSLGGPGEALPLERSALEVVVQSGQPLAREDLLLERRFWSDELLLAEGFRSVLYVPVHSETGEQLIVELASRSSGRYAALKSAVNGLVPTIEALVRKLRPGLPANVAGPMGDDLLDRLLHILQQPFGEAFPQVMEAVRERIPWDGAMVETLAASRRELEVTALAPPASGPLTVGERFLLEGSRLAAVTAEPVPTAAPDLTVIRPYWTDALLYQQGYRSAAFLPLQQGGRVFGLWTVARRRLQPFSAQELADLHKLSGVLALAASATSREAPEATGRHDDLLTGLLGAVVGVDAATEEEVYQLTIARLRAAGFSAFLIRPQGSGRFVVLMSALGGPPLRSSLALPVLRPQREGKVAFLTDVPEPGNHLFALPVTLREEPAYFCVCSPAFRLEDTPVVEAFGRQLTALTAVKRLQEQLAAAQRDLDQKVAERTAQLTILHDFSQELSYSLNEADILRLVFSSLRRILPFDIGGAVLCQEHQHYLTIHAVRPAAAAVLQRFEEVLLNSFHTFAQDQHERCVPLRQLPAPDEWEPSGALLNGELRMTLDAPILAKGRVTGLLKVAAEQEEAFSSEQTRIFYTIVNQASVALERLEALRREEKSKLEALLESVSEGIMLVDAECRPLAVNAVARELVAALGGSTAGEIKLDQTPLAPLIAEVAAGKAALSRELTTAEGRRTFAVTIGPLSGSTGANEIVVTLRDITEERLIQERLLQSEKMASVGQLVSGVAHELNNPLTGVLGFAQLLMSRDLDEGARWQVQTIYSEAERAAKIVQNLLSFARRRRPEKELININQLIERVIELRGYELRVNNIEVDLQLDPALPATMADPDQIQQVLFNIISNAEQAMLKAHGRGTLTIKTAAQGDVLVLRVSDDGPGIPPQNLRRVFDPFFTTKEVGEGTGLGLSICYGIVAEHGGRIWAESPAGSGATFVIELPIVAGTPVERPPVEPEPARPAIPVKHILVVDDEETIQDLLIGILSADGHRVEAVGNGSEALERIQQQPYDLVITDIKMPGLDGTALYRAVQAQKPDLADRIIFITGDTISPQTRHFIQQIGNPFLPKPFKVRELRETVQRLLDQGGGGKQ